MRSAIIGHFTGQVVHGLGGGGGGRVGSAGAVEGKGVALLAYSPLTSRQLSASTGHRISQRNATVSESHPTDFTSRRHTAKQL